MRVRVALRASVALGDAVVCDDAKRRDGLPPSISASCNALSACYYDVMLMSRPCSRWAGLKEERGGVGMHWREPGERKVDRRWGQSRTPSARIMFPAMIVLSRPPYSPVPMSLSPQLTLISRFRSGQRLHTYSTR